METLGITGATISNNTATGNGGGLLINNSTSGTDTTATINATSILTNTATGSGGGVYITGGSLTVENGSSISGNTAGTDGGGIFNAGALTIDNATVASNTASGAGATNGGGGIFNAGGSVVTDAATTISNNSADGTSGSGGGIFNDTGGTLDINGSTISGNEANRAGGGIEENSGNYPYSAFNSFSVQLDDVTISGNTAGPTGSANPGSGGGVHITGGSSVDIQGSTVIDGNGAAAEGGGLWNSSNGGLRLQGPVIVQNNVATGNGSDQGGGGIFTDGGTVIITGTALIQDNDATGTSGSGGGIFSTGGGTDANGNPAVFNVLGATIRNNTAVRAGGGVEIVDGTFNITDSTIDGNGVATTPTAGGGLHITGSGEVDMKGSTISNNEADEGGGLWVSSTGTFIGINSTISSNSANSGDGGGIYNAGGGTVDLHSVTITLNDASTGVGSGIAGGSGGVTLQNTIVAQNPGGGTEENLSGTIASDDHNLIGDPDDGTVTGNTDQTIFGANALLGPLQNNGGFTDTHLPSAGSPAIDNGDALDTDNSTELADDQRNTVRPQGARDDIGAVEVQLNGLIISAGPAAGDGSPDEFLIQMDNNGTADPSDDDIIVSINGVPGAPVDANSTGQIIIQGSSDDDTLVLDNDGVDGDDGLVRPDIIFNGGLGFDLLQLDGTTPTTTTYNPGPTDDAGAVYQVDAAQLVQQVQFTGLEPVQVQGTGAGDTLIVGGQPLGANFPQALNADNAISYAEGPNSNQPLDPFFAGDSTGLVTVDGFETLEFSNFGTLQIDAGAGSDEISLNNPNSPTDMTDIDVNGSDPTGGSDTVVVSGTTAADTITIDQLTNDGAVVTGAQPVTVTIDEAEELLIEGQGGGDSLTYTSSGADIVLQPGDVADAASIAADGSGTGGLLPVSYAGLGNLGSLTFTPTGARNDGIDIYGNGADNQFDVDAAGTVQVSKVGFGIAQTLPISADSATYLRLIGEDGDDIFNVAADHPFTTGVEVQGGDPGASDILNFTGTGSQLTLNLTAGSVVQSGSTPVLYSGAEVVNIDVAGANIVVEGKTAKEDFIYTPTATDGGTLELAGTDTVFNLSNVSPTTLIIDGNGSENTLTVRGTSGADTIDVGINSIDVAGLLPVVYQDMDGLTVEAGEGNDQIAVDVEGTDLISETLTVNGGTGDDSLTVSGTPSVTVNGVTYDPGPTADAGQLNYESTGNNMAISFTGLEPVIDLVPATTLTVNGTGDDNAISYSHVGGNGLVAVDGFETIEFANKGNLVVDGAAGTDTLTVNGVAGSVDVLTVTPTGQDAGTVSAAAITDVDYGSVENLNLVGQVTDFDSFAVEGTSGGDLFEYFSGLTPDAGTVEGLMNDAGFTLPTIQFSGMNPIVNRTFNGGASGGQDDFLFRGTFSDDEIAYDGSGLLTNANDGTPIASIDVGTSTSTRGIIIEGDDGDDTIDVTPEDGVVVIVRGGNNSPGSDVLNYNAAGNVTIELSNRDIEDDGSSGTRDASFAGIEVVNVAAGGNDVTFEGTTGNEDIIYTPTGPAAGTIEVAGGSTVFNLSNVATATTLTIDGSGGSDTLTVEGTSSGDSDIDADVPGGNVTVSGLLPVDFTDIDALNLSGRQGTDIFNIIPGAIPVFVDGGDPISAMQGTGDVLNVVSGGASYVFEQGPEEDEGRFTVDGTEPVSFDHIELFAVDGLPYVRPDRFEANDSIAEATVLGSEQKITLRDLTAHRTSSTTVNEDFFQITAQDTGKLIINAFFSDAVGNLDLEVLDADGDQVALADSITDDEQIIIPVVGQQQYFLRVYSADDDPAFYDLEIENFMAPVPNAVDLDPDDDTGVSNTDDLTREDEGTITIEADLTDFENEGINILNPADVLAGESGAAVEVFVDGSSVGYATLVGGTNYDLFEYTFEPGELAEGVNYVKGAVRVFDAQDPSQSGRSQLSNPLVLTLDTTAPTPTLPDLLTGSDTGASDVDDITAINEPAFNGLAEANSLVRIYANGELVGEDVVGSDASDGVTGDGMGEWEITSEPLADGTYLISTQVEDLAGNVTAFDSEIYGVNQAEDLFEVDVDTGLATLIGGGATLPSDYASEVEYHPGRAELYVTSGFSGDPDELHMIDPFTGTSVGSVTLTGDLAGGEAIPGLEVVDGTLYGTVTTGGGSPSRLVTIDPETGVVSNVGATGLSRPISALTWDSSTSTLYGLTGGGPVSQLVTIDTATGLATAVGDIEVGATGVEDVGGLVFDTDGTLYAGVAWAAPSFAGDILEVDPATGDSVLVGDTVNADDSVSGLTFVGLTLEVDTSMPQRPTIDLVNEDDTGISNTDNITIGRWAEAGFRISAEMDSEVVIKDGDTVIDTFTFDAAFDSSDGVMDGFGVRNIDFKAVESTYGIPGQGTHPLSAEATDAAGNMKQSEEERVEITSTELALIDFRQYVDGTVVSVYDVDPSNGISDPNIAWMGCQFTDCADILIGHRGGNVINFIRLADGGGSTEDIGITVENVTWIPSVVDARTDDTDPIGFFASEGQVGSAFFRSDLAGGDINGFTAEGLWKLPDDPDRDGDETDLTGWFSGATTFNIHVRGDIEGDVVSDQGQLWKVVANGGDISGDLWAAGNIGWVRAQNGSVEGDVTAGCRIFDVLAINGDVSGDVTAPKSIGTVMAINGDVTGGVGTIWTEGRLNRVMAIGGGVTTDIHAGSIGVIGATDGPIESVIDTTSGGIGHMFSIGGGMEVDIDSAGGIGGIFTTGDLEDSVIDATNYLGSVTVRGSMEDTDLSVSNSYLGSVNVSGDILNSHIRLSDGPDDDDLSGYLGRVYSGGNMHNTTIEARRLGSVYVRGAITEDNSDGDTDVIRALEGRFWAQDSTGLGGPVYLGQDQWFDEGEPDGQRAFIDDLDD